MKPTCIREISSGLSSVLNWLKDATGFGYLTIDGKRSAMFNAASDSQHFQTQLKT
jgi:hypothetical protein